MSVTICDRNKREIPNKSKDETLSPPPEIIRFRDTRMKALISAAEAQRRILAHLPDVPAIQCPLTKCAGRVLRQSLQADRPFPPFDRSMMDGYAIRAIDISQAETFSITAQAPAGSPPVEIGAIPGSCAEIMTGAVLPADADCVVPYEATERISNERMLLKHPGDHTAGNCIHRLGSDHPAGQVLLTPGGIIGSREIAVAATCGYTELAVSKIPSIAIVSTGDELVDVADLPKPHQIRRSNDLMIETALARVQLHALNRTHLPDSPEVSRETLEQLILTHNYVIISGGISMGKKDYIPEVLQELGLECHFHGIAQKPGKPMGYWSNADCGVFTLPGNPLSTLTCLHHYTLPAIRSAMGQTSLPAGQQVALTEAVKARDDFTVFLPVQRAEDNQARPYPAQNSGDLVRILASDGYIELAPTPAKSYPAGIMFTFHPWH